MTDAFLGIFAVGCLGALIYFPQRARMYGHHSLGIILAFLFSPYAGVIGCYWLVKDAVFMTREEARDSDYTRT